MAETISTTCCIAGGGPAGMMLGFLLARAGVDVLVLEKHIDFFRDFRGDTIHPSTLELIHELGLLPDLLALPHQKLRSIQAVFGSRALTIADFEYLPTECGFIAFMPQWDFLDFLARHARTYPSFELRMGCAATDLVERDGIVTGVRATTANGALEVSAALTVAADATRIEWDKLHLSFKLTETAEKSAKGIIRLALLCDKNWISRTFGHLKLQS